MANDKELIIPTFTAAFFSFEDPDSIPEHHDREPDIPSCVDRWILYLASGGKVITSAVDILDESQARLLAEAKARYFEESIERFSYSMDVYILNPAGESSRYYVGRTIDR